MSASNSLETSILKLYFQNIADANIGDVAGLLGSAVPGSFYIGLHTGDPGEGGDQTTNEATYTGYQRQAVARSVAGFTVTGNQVTNAATVAFGECTVGSDDLTHFSVGTASAGAGRLLWKGALTSLRSVSAGIAPYFPAGELVISND